MDVNVETLPNGRASRLAVGKPSCSAGLTCNVSTGVLRVRTRVRYHQQSLTEPYCCLNHLAG
jgi:hypothetical protein